MKDSVKLWCINELDNLELLSAHFIQQSFPWHSHPTYSIAIIEEGTETLVFRRQTIYATAGSIVIINPNEAHANHAGGDIGWQYRNIYITADHLFFACSNFYNPIHNPPYFPEKVIQDASLFFRLKQVHQRLQEQGLTKPNEELLFSLLGELVHKYATLKPLADVPTFNSKLIDVVEIINQNPGNTMPVEQLARQAGLSQFHFIRRFNQMTGLTPTAYILQKRIELAKSLLRQRMPVVEVALETGFFDQSHFSRYFKKLTGTTPRDLG